MFEISNTLSFNKDKLVDGNRYDYVTRTSLNQGILRTTGFVNEKNINPSGTWSLGLLQMDFFYRKKPWYAGQFIRIISSKINIPLRAIPFITTILNLQKKVLLSVLVRNVDKTFNELMVNLPTKNGEIDFEFMESFVAELEAQRVAELEAYLLATGLKDYELTDEEKQAIDEIDKIQWKEFDIIKVFNVKNTKNILSTQVEFNSGNTPYLCASAENNGVASYITFNDLYIDKGNCIFIGGKTFTVSYQKEDFYSNDSHNLALYLICEDMITEKKQLYMATCIKKGLGHKYSWGNSISNRKIQTDTIMLPSHNKHIDYEYMETLISAVQKLVIKDVVLYADSKIEATRQVIKR